MLTVRSFAHAVEAVALNYALETLTLRGTDNGNFFAFCEDVAGDALAYFLYQWKNCGVLLQCS